MYLEKDIVWEKIRTKADQVAVKEPVLADLLNESVLNCSSLEESLSYRISRKLGHYAISEPLLHDLFIEIFEVDEQLGIQASEDIQAIYERDPACCSLLCPILYFKGFQALTAYRIAHYLYRHDRVEMALYLQSIISQVFGVDIHPAARIESGILLDHATSIVIGETAVVEKNVSILHEVTLGGTGKDQGDRHPKVREGVLIGAGAKILGNVEIGRCSKIGAGSVVLNDIPPRVTVAGVPAKIVNEVCDANPAESMNQSLFYK